MPEADHSSVILQRLRDLIDLSRRGQHAESAAVLAQVEKDVLPTDSPTARIGVIEARINALQRENALWDKIEAQLEAAERIAEASGEPELQALTLFTCAEAASAAQRYDEALASLQRLRRIPGLPTHSKVQAYVVEAVTQHYIGQLGAAKRACELGLEEVKDDPVLEARLRANLALTLFHLDEKDEARRQVEAVIGALTAHADDATSAETLSSAHLTRAMLKPKSQSSGVDLQRALELLEAIYGPESPSLIPTLTTQGWGLIELGALDEAEAAIQRGLKLAKSAGLIAFHELTLMENLTTLRLRQKRPDDAKDLAAQMRDVWANWVPLVLEAGSEADRLNLLRQSHWVDTAVAAGEPEPALQAIVSSYGAVLDSLLRDTALAARLPRDQRQRYFQNQARLAALTFQTDARTDEVSTLRRLLQATAPPSTPPSLAALQAALPQEAALVVFSPYRNLDGRPTQRLAAAVITPSDKQLVLLAASCSAIRNVGDDLIKSLESPSNNQAADKHLQDLREALVTPLKSTLGDATQLFLCLDGCMNRVPATLWPAENVTFLTSPQALLRKAPKATALAGSASNSTWMLVNTGRNDLNFAPDQPFPYNLTNDIVDHKLPALPGTERELTALFESHPERWAILRTQLDDDSIAEPSESVFIQSLIDPPAVIHIAGHAAHQSPGLESASASSTWWQGQEQPRALWTSCLFFPDPQPIVTASDDLSTDNYLFAAEIAGLDLTGTQLVTLSACKTGTGPSPMSEGSYSLARAFHSAGVRDVLSCTEPLPDANISKLMIPFYDRLTKGEDAAQAFWKEQNQAIGDDVAKLLDFGFFRLTRAWVALPAR